MLDRLCVLFDFELVLGEFPRDTRHVGRRPCEDILVLTQELDKLAFLIAVKIGADGSFFGGVVFCQLDLLGTV